jgi:radical SAM protein with 4Fe4S-binding SPASM domain
MHKFKGREWFREYHESEYDPVIESNFDNIEDERDCPNCKYEAGCEGGCLGRKFEEKEGEED